MSAGELALTALTGLDTSLKGIGYASNATLKTVKAIKAAQLAEKLKGASAIKKIAIKYGFPIAREALENGAFAALLAAKNEKATTEEIVKSAESGALFGALFTAGAIVVGKGLAKASSKFSGAYNAARKKIETVANKDKILKNTTQIQKTLSYIGEEGSFKQKLAKKTLKGIQFLDKLKMRFLDRFSPLERIEKSILDIKGVPLAEEEKIYRNVRLLSSVADNKAEVLVKNYSQQLKKYDDIVLDKARAYLTQLDLIDRKRLGQKVAGDQSLEQLKKGLIKIIDEIGDTDMRKVATIRSLNRKFNIDLLNQRVDAGLITSELRESLIKTHPNYIPHNVILDIDERNIRAISNSLNVAKTDIMKSVGSTKNIKDPFAATIGRTPIATRTIEKNKLLNNIIEAQEKYNVLPGAKGLVTAKQVKRRVEIFSELRNLKAELKIQVKSLRASKKMDRTTASKISSLQKELLKIEKQFGDEFSRFLMQGEKVTKTLPKRQIIKGVGKLPDNLKIIGDKIKKYKTFKALMDSSDGIALEKLYESGFLERAGFKDATFKKGKKEIVSTGIKQFYNFVKKPFKELPIRESKTILKGNIDKLIKLTAGREKIKLQKEILENVDLLSSKDAVRFFTEVTDNIKATRKNLWLESQSLKKLRVE
ncbi:MAG: hypothetical protein ACTSPI_06735 [Candidatus Heimdallarchaeaceae archaeon]